MPRIIPPSRPLQSRDETRKLIPADVTDKVIAIGKRGYYRDTMGQAGENDRGIYDDALFILSPTAYASFNANTDPSVQRRGIAVLEPGVHRYRPGKHGLSRPGGGYPAFRPATKGETLPVRRDGSGELTTGVATNIHKGGYGTTSSLGCQTIYPDQWNAFQSLLMSELKRHGQTTFPYVLA